MSFIEETDVSKSSFIKNIAKYAMTAVAIATLSIVIDFSTASAQGTNQIEGIQTIYHVYLGDESIGAVNDKSVINKVIGEAILKAESKDPNHNYVLGQDVTYVPEKMFFPEYNNSDTIDKLKQAMTIQAQAVALKIGGKTIGYLKNQKQVDDVLHKYKLLYISDNDLKTYEDNKQNGFLPNEKGTLADLSGSNILDISFSQDVTSVDSSANPKDILSVDDALKLLTTGHIIQKKYDVQSGDILGKIASKFNLSTKQLLDLNPNLDKNSILHVGDQLTVTAPKPLLDVVVKKYISKDVDIPYQVDKKENNNMYKGEHKVIQRGKKGLKHIEENETITNGHVTNKDVISSNVTQKPRNEVLEIGTKVVPSRGTGNLHWPAEGGIITSPFGWRTWDHEFHKGIDISGVSNRSILAADNGVVTYAQWDSGGYGNRIIINHHNGMKTTYNHLSRIKVHVGQVVRRGQVIGIMGSTGDSTGMHLHFEVYQDGHLKNPMNYFH